MTLGAMKANEFWSRRGGFITKAGERVFKGRRRMSQGRANSGPTGRALRRRRGDGPDIGRRRAYANPKLQRRASRVTFEEERERKKQAARKGKRVARQAAR